VICEPGGPHELTKAMGLGNVQVGTWEIASSQQVTLGARTECHLRLEGYEYRYDDDDRILLNDDKTDALHVPVTIEICCAVTRPKEGPVAS
jgi:hypothetical protein